MMLVFNSGPQRAILRYPILQGYIAEHSGLQLLVVSAHIKKTNAISDRYRVAGLFSANS
jgi:hypothetical protein